MRTSVWIEQEIEVEVSAADAVAAICALDEPDRLPMAINGISNCLGFLKRIPDALIIEMKEAQRKIIVDALEAQAARYRIPMVIPGGPGMMVA